MMEKTVISRLTFIVCCLVLAACIMAKLATGQSASETQEPATQQTGQSPFIPPFLRPTPDHTVSIRPVMSVVSGQVVPGTGTILVRTKETVFATMHTSGLTPGTAVTFWFGIFNSPGNCATRPCTAADFANPNVQGSVANGGGQIIGADGTVTYGAFRTVGDTTGVAPGIGTGQGLLDPRRAEIHLVTRFHGPANLIDLVILGQQLSMFNGGCPPNTCTNLQASIHQP